MKSVKEVRKYLSNEEAFKIVLDGGNVFIEGCSFVPDINDLLNKDRKFFTLVKKEVRIIEVNGEVFYPETVYPKNGDTYFYLDSLEDVGYDYSLWDNCIKDMTVFKRGIFKDENEIKRLVAALEK